MSNIRGKKIYWNCMECNIPCTDYASQRKGNKGKFCSRSCAARNQLKGNKINVGKRHSDEWRLMMRTKLSGDKCYLWKGGVTPLNESIRKSAEYKIWRDKVYERDNWTCQICGIYGVDVHVDHIKPFAFFPELRFDVDNGRVLCVPCHKKTDTWGYGSVKLYGNKRVVT